MIRRGKVGARGMLLRLQCIIRPPAQQALARRLHPVRPVRRLSQRRQRRPQQINHLQRLRPAQSLRQLQETGVRRPNELKALVGLEWFG